MSTSQIHFLPVTDIIAKESRFRKLFSDKNSADLQDSISTGPGLINAITVRPSMELITGESRLKAITLLHDIGLPVRYNGSPVASGLIPVIIVADSLSEIDLLKAELHENTVREGFTYLEEAQAVSKIALLEQALINLTQKPAAERIAEAKAKAPVLGIPLARISPEALKATAEKLYEGKSGGSYTKAIKDSLLITDVIDKDPSGSLAKLLEKAPDMSSAQKILKRHAEADLRTSLALTQGKSFSNKIHSLIHGDCLEELAKLPPASIDVCLTDPIYGINAGNFSDQGGRMSGSSHEYNDSLENFKEIMPKALKLVSKVLKERAHIYLACDLRNYPLLKQMLADSSVKGNEWRIPNAPFIQYKVGGGRVPHPGYTPRRSYEIWLYAYRGDKQEYKLINDVIECTSDRSESHGAGKPKDLLKVFLSRSCMPGDKVLDFMAGTGSVIPACHELKLSCTAIELEAEYYGRMLERVRELK
jgi:DNA modification methylase/ParB-like chromosome segregation protein Spo0J